MASIYQRLRYHTAHLWNALGTTRLIVAVILVTWVPSASGAQGVALPEAETGAAHFTPRIASIGWGVDTNLFNSQQNAESDFLLFARPELDASTGYRPVRFTATAAADLQYFAAHEAERSVNPEVSGRFEASLRRITLFAAATYRNTRRRPDETLEVIDIEARARRVRFTPEAGVNVRISPKSSAQFTLRRVQLEFDADEVFEGTNLAETLNRNEEQFSSTFNYQLTPITGLYARARRREIRFPLSPSRDADSWNLSPGVRFNALARVSGVAEVGYESLRPHSVSLSGFTGLSAAVNLSYRLSPSSTISAAVNRAPGFSFSRIEPYYLWNGIRLGFGQQLGDRLGLALNVGRSRYRYEDVGTLSVLPPSSNRTDTLRNDGVSMSYRFTTQTQIGVGVSYRSRQSERSESLQYSGYELRFSIDRGL